MEIPVHRDWEACSWIEGLTYDELPDSLRSWFKPVRDEHDPDDELGIEPEGATLYRSTLTFESPIMAGIIRADFYRLDLPDDTLYTFAVMETKYGDRFVDDVRHWKRNERSRP